MRYLQDFGQDLRYALRSLGQSPGFAAVAILSAALGIGACSTIFGIANFALFSELPVRDASRLVSITGTSRGEAGKTVSYPTIEALRSGQSFAGVAAHFPMVTGAFAANQNPQQAPSRHWGALVTENFFTVAQVPFALGRGFVPDQKERALVLSHSLWQSEFHADPAIVGKPIVWNGKPVTVVGVAAAGFRGTEPLFYSEFWVPFALIDEIPSLGRDPQRFQHGNQWLFPLARLKPGVDFATARAELEVIAKRLATQRESYQNRSFHLQRAGAITPLVQRLMLVFFAVLTVVTALVLLVASANVASLLLARGTQREREIATRLAVGAGRGRLVRQLLTESLLLAFLGGLSGCVLAVLATSSLGKFELPVPVPVDLRILLDYRILLFSTLLSLVTGLLFGVLPAWRSTGLDLSQGMKLRQHRRFGLRNGLIVAQVAISMVLLLCSGLFLRSLSSAQSIDIGMSAREVLFLAVDPSLQQYDDARARRFFVNALDRVRALSGVESAAFTQAVPLSLGGSSSYFTLPGSQKEISTDIFAVTPGYFRTMGIPLRHGADFTGREMDKDAIVLNERAAVAAFGERNAVGRTLQFDGRAMRVAAVVANSKSRTLGEEPRNILYRPLYENQMRGDSFLGYTLAVRTAGDAAGYTAAVRREIQALDPALAIFDVRTWKAHQEKALFLPRLGALMFGLCGAVALVLSTIGLYGVVSFQVAQRTREIGIRMALGAPPSQVLGWMLRIGLALAGVGIAIGLAAALGVSRVTASLLYGIAPNDLLTFTAVPLFLLSVVAVACWIPARRAAALDPARTLRAD